MNEVDLTPCRLCAVPMSESDCTLIDVNMPTEAPVCWDCVDCVLRHCKIDHPSRTSILTELSR